MANTIQTLSGNQIIQMQNARFARIPLAGLFSGYTKLRVGLWANASDIAQTLYDTALFIGVCSGTTNIYGNPTVTHALGIKVNGGAASRYAGPPVEYGTMATYGTKQVGVTKTLTAAISGNNFLLVTNRGAHFVDIETGSPNYTLRYFRPNSTTTADCSEATFDAQVIVASPTITNHGQVSTTIACNEGVDGTFDAVNVCWPTAGPTFHIHKLTMVKLA